MPDGILSPIGIVIVFEEGRILPSAVEGAESSCVPSGGLSVYKIVIAVFEVET
jgi:hypothetical protein